ncbi:MAG: hypothetical protein LBC09_03035 [Helicobacteraceae bacterium]|jgi:exopolyphosphatase/guanosine-5'-triphosphate,3'-diphosphate pyrophosphatase|nr:hypothetical protein [Helicobacteraceae bacterium]
MIAIDLGSNTIRFLAVDQNGNELWERQFVVRTAENLAQSGEIGQAALDRVAEAFAAARAEFDFSPHKVAAVATEAFRRAKNQKAALKFLSDNCGADFEVISAQTEARLAAAATAQSARRKGLKEPFISLDIGGASSEIAYTNGDIFRFISLPIGIVTIAESQLDDQALDRRLNDELKALDAFKREISDLPRAQMIATAGAPTTLAAVKLGLTYENYDKRLINGVVLSAGEIIVIREKLKSLDRAELEKLTGKDRGDLVIVGAAMLRYFMIALGYEQTAVFDEGLREGVAAAAFQKLA